MALESAARKLGKDIASEGVQIVDAKYGKDAAVLADNAMHAAGHGTMTAWNVYVSEFIFLKLLVSEDRESADGETKTAGNCRCALCAGRSFSCMSDLPSFPL